MTPKVSDLFSVPCFFFNQLFHSLQMDPNLTMFGGSYWQDLDVEHFVPLLQQGEAVWNQPKLPNHFSTFPQVDQNKCQLETQYSPPTESYDSEETSSTSSTISQDHKTHLELCRSDTDMDFRSERWPQDSQGWLKASQTLNYRVMIDNIPQIFLEGEGVPVERVQTESIPSTHIRSVSSIIQSVLYADEKRVRLSKNYPQFSPIESRVASMPPLPHSFTEIDNAICLENVEYYPPSSAKKVAKLSQNTEPSNPHLLGCNSDRTFGYHCGQVELQLCSTSPETPPSHFPQRMYQYHPYIPPFTHVESNDLGRKRRFESSAKKTQEADER